MDFADAFQAQFEVSPNYISTDLDLNKRLQDTRHALQEATSENDQLAKLIDQLYFEARVENVATEELLSEIKQPIFRNIPLPRNADDLSLSEKAGYTVYCLKFLGFAARKSVEEYESTKDHLTMMHSSIRKQTAEVIVKRTGDLKIPELDGQKESKRGSKSTTPATPPATPPEKVSKSKK